jgi:phosphatidylserine/phosphatidylglycerophosphate/cardiolipin synthase-like enzyme
VGFLVIAAAIIKLDLHFGRGVRAIEQWFADAQAATKVRVRALHTELFSITHTKLVIDGEKKAILLGSPFEQVYYDSQTHVLDEPRRGDDAGVGPIHDVSVSVRGPAVGHMQEVFNSHWNLADPADQLPLPPPNIPQVSTTENDELLTSVQVVRTLNPRTFANVPPNEKDGEQGILEAYLRAIHFAERFIYIENQYFNDEPVTEALIDVLKNKTNVKVILLLNVTPDMPHYPMWQRTTIIRLAEAAGNDVANRLGVFTKWSHANSNPPTHPKPRLAKHYLHTKTSIIDNKWATVGSGNIDGASLDQFQAFWYSKLANVVLEGGAARNTETNCVVFEETPPAKSAVDDLRRRLWAEHLGFFDSSGKITPGAADLQDSPTKDWLAVWVDKANAKKAKLVATPDDPSPITILPWPEPKKVGKATSESHLKLLEIPVEPFDLVPHGAPSFDFKTGQFKK